MTQEIDHAAMAAGVGTNLPYLNWFLNHLQDAPAVSTDIQAMAAATNVSDRWLAFKPLGDLVFTKWSVDFPGAAAVTATPATAAQLETAIRMRAENQGPNSIYAKIGDGNILKGLQNLVGLVSPYLPLILSLFGVSVPAGLIPAAPVAGKLAADEALVLAKTSASDVKLLCDRVGKVLDKFQTLPPTARTATEQTLDESEAAAPSKESL